MSCVLKESFTYFVLNRSKYSLCLIHNPFQEIPKCSCQCSKSELIESDSDSALKLVEYCSGSAKWHFANIMPADCEVANMVMKVFGRTTNVPTMVTNIDTFNVQACSLVMK